MHRPHVVRCAAAAACALHSVWHAVRTAAAAAWPLCWLRVLQDEDGEVAGLIELWLLRLQEAE
jgi:pheromone shutdown protein TraB